MNKNNLLISLLVILLSGCSTYRTNSDVTFRSTVLSGEHPVIPVGKDVPSSMVTYLGWIEAEVSSPSYFSKPPTQEQVDIVLANKGKAMGADAVIHVEYGKKVNAATLGKLTGKGQAVRINAWHLGEPDPSIVMSDNLRPSTNREHELEALINPATPTKNPPIEPQTLALNTAAATVGLTQPNSNSTQSFTAPAKTSKAEIASLQQILKEAEQLKEHAKRNKDKAMYKTANLLVRQLEDHIIEYTDSFE